MKNKYVFILSITLISSMLLALFSEGLKERTALNKELDKKKNVLQSIGVDIQGMTQEKLIKSFTQNVKEVTLDISGNIIDNVSHHQLELNINKINGQAKYEYLNVEYLPAYISDSRNAIIIPVSGKGLWSTLYGYFAVDLTNYSTVKGITFYQHGETPGLGAEITKDWFKSSFVGKELYLENELRSISVLKPGQANDADLYAVDGISGATITSRGVEDLLKRDLLRYEPFFRKNK